MVKSIDEKRLPKKHGNIKVFHFLGARIEDVNQYIIPVIKRQPDYLILHVGTNDAATSTSKQLPSCRIVLSKPIIRHDDGKATLTIRNINRHCQLYSQNTLKTIILVYNILNEKDFI